MGVECYVVCDATREKFELGKGPWRGCKGLGGVPPDFNELGLNLSMAGRGDMKTFCDHVIACWSSGYIERPPDVDYVRSWASRLWSWCVAMDWCVRFVTDHDSDDSWYDYKLIDSRYEAS